MKFTFKRVLSFAIALVMILGLLPTIQQHAHAAGDLSLSVSDLAASWTDASNSSGKAFWSAGSDGKSITGKATGYKWSGVLNRAITTTLVLTNNKSGEAILSFNYTLTGGGSVKADVGTMANDTYSGTLAAGASVTITLTSPSGASTNTLTITDLSLVLNATGDVNTTFHAPVTGGSYKVDGTAINSDTVKTAMCFAASFISETAGFFKVFSWGCTEMGN